jgi:uncharacterized protein
MLKITTMLKLLTIPKSMILRRNLILVGCAISVAASVHATGTGTASREGAALIEAATQGDIVKVKQLLAPGASGAASAALVAATYGNQLEVTRLLIEAGANVNAQDDLKNSAYLLAGARGHLGILKLTLPKADFKSLNRYGGTALIPACHYGHVETVRELLKWPVDINHVNNLGWTAMLETVILGDGSAAYIEITKLLIGAKANLNIADRQGISPLQHAKQRNQTEVARLLTAAGAR